MKTMIVMVAVLAMATIAAGQSLPVTQANIEKAENTPSAAKNFNPCPSDMPNGPDADKKGNTVIFVKDGKMLQYGSDMTPREAYMAYCSGGGGE